MERKLIMGIFIFSGAGLGWVSTQLINEGMRSGWVFFIMSMLCLQIAWCEHRTRYVGGV